VKINGLEFSLSGMENKVQELSQSGQSPEAVAAFTLDTLAALLRRVTAAAQDQYPGLPLLCSGGVASNSRLRYVLGEFCQAFFAEPQYSTDNAMGVAILGHRLAGK